MNNKPTTEAGRCQNHCIHPLTAMRNGACGFIIGVNYFRLHGDVPSVCGHRCQPPPRTDRVETIYYWRERADENAD